MSLRLVDDELGFSIDIPVDADLREALDIQLQRCMAMGTYSPFHGRLVRGLIALIDGDLRPPTASQISYALSIAKVLAVSLPGEALRFRGSMTDFLNHFAPLFKERCRPAHSTNKM